jgi:hypothetical protein
MRDADGRARVATAALVWLLALAGYLATRPRLGYNSDVYAYVVAVHDGAPGGLFNPHHLLYNATGHAWTRLAGRPPTSLAGTAQSLRAMNAVFGSLSVLAFFLLTGRFLRDRASRLLATACFATCFATWMFSVDVEVYVPSTMFLAFASLLLLRAAAGGPLLLAAGAGALMGLGCLYHQMGVLFAAVAVAALARGPLPARARGARLVSFFVAASVVVVPVYLWAAVARAGVDSPSALLAWLLGYALRGYGAGWGLDGLRDLVLGHGRSLVFFEFVLRDLQRDRGGLALDLALVGAAAAALALGAFGAWRGWARSGPAAAAIPLLAWYLAYGLFTLWWEPENPEFWVTAMVPFWALWAGGLALAGGRWRGLLAGFLVLMLACNLRDLLARRDPRADPGVAAVLAMAERARGAVVVLPPTLDAAAAFFAPELRRISPYQACKASPGRPAAARSALDGQVRAALAEGRRVLLYERAFSREVTDPHPWCASVEEDLLRGYERATAFTVEMPVDDDERTRARRPARWRALTVYELRPRVSGR